MYSAQCKLQDISLVWEPEERISLRATKRPLLGLTLGHILGYFDLVQHVGTQG